MSVSRRLIYRLLGGLAALALLAGVPVKAQTVAVSEAARAALPERVRQEGVLRIATSLQWAPFAYRSERDEPVGIDISLARLLAAKLGLQPSIDDMKFPTIITGVTSGRYHIGVNQLSMTPERLAAVDMVPYFSTTSVVLVRRGKTIGDLGNLCGMTFVVTQGSVQIRQLNQMSEACKGRGQAEIVQQLYPSSADTLLALSNGRGDAFLTAAPQGVYISRINSRVALIPGDVPDTERFPAGIMVEKGNAAMRRAVALALASAIEDGSYRKILEEYGVASAAVSAETVMQSAN
ncbi:transporter substrate-binding domain-containing protein [Siccirubricoccus phaeus]|uniref:transporter substrate-binding domain-containing protein n=1 Tax=Siccirubricoccus phaeus TaxID=2595053 RepID=UPI0011F1E2C2|nr:transporter substrate-binding domain-containing protein [Siccirubricoccus phaeus]